MRHATLVLSTLAVLAAPGAGNAQTAWDSPLLLPPRPGAGTGIFLTEMDNGGVGVLGMWRPPQWNYGVRAGISEGSGGEGVAILGGVDYSGPVNRSTADFPIDVDWVFGAGVAIDDGLHEGIRLGFPLGLSAAHGFQAASARFTPFVTPRVILDAFIDSDRDELSLSAAADLGLDLFFMDGGGPFNGMTIRFAATIGNRTAIGVGLVF